ncbi:MAG: hypothetical protein V1774_05345 [Candidatus Eisenbacteria bacterium]
MPGRSLQPARSLLVLLLCVLCYVAPAAPQYFGQNKVPGPAREWRQLESPHFVLYFYEGERELAQRALPVAERAYARLARLYGHEASERIPVILYSSQDEFRETRAVSSLIGEGTGGVTEFLKRRVIVPATGSFAEFDHVFTHELTHAFELDMLASGVGGGGIDPLSWTPPLWVMEGLAEYLSIPGLDTQTEMWLRDAALEGTLPTLQELDWIADLRVYRFGQSIVAHVAEQFGDEMLGPWLRGMARRRSASRGTSEVLGMTLEQLSEDWHDALRRRYLPAVAQHAGLEDSARRLTDHRRTLANFYVTPAVSPDGGRFVYVADDSPYADLYVASAIDGTHRRRLIAGERRETFESLRYFRTTFEWSPDGERVALIALSGGRDRLLIFNVAEGKTERSFEFGFDEMLSPTWSPTGERIAFVGLRGGESDLYALRLEDGSLEALTDDPWATFQPAWSSDGTRIAFVTDRDFQSLAPRPGSSPWHLGILDLASGETSIVRGTSGKSINPQWFPDGRHLLYVSDRDGIANLYIRDLDRAADWRLTDVVTGVAGITATAAAASLSRDGRRVVFSVYARSGWDIFAIKDPLGAIKNHDPWEAPAPAAAVAAAPAALGAAPDPGTVASPSPLVQEDSTAAVGVFAPEPSPAWVDSLAHRLAAQAGDSLTAGVGPGGERKKGLFSRPAVGPEYSPVWPEDVPVAGIDLSEIYRETAALPDTFAVTEKPYHPRMSIDFAQAGGLYASGYGAVAQTLLVFSDMLGDRNLYVGADVSGSFEEGSYYLGYLNQRRRPALLFSLYQYQTGYGYGTVPGYPEVYQKRLVRGAGAAAYYPLSRFRRIEVFVDAIQEKRYEWLCEEIAQDELWRCGWKDEHIDQTYVAPGIAMVFDSALFGPTGPLSGRRTRIGAGVSFGQRRAGSFDLDHRVYQNIRKRYAFAGRLVMAGEWGPDRQEIAFGGPFSLRGYLDYPLYGTSIAFTNLEFRFPFIDAFYLAWPLRIGIGGIRGSLFFDMGAAWDDPELFRGVRSGRGEGSFHLEDIRASCGFRASLNVGFAILRWDLSRRTDLAGWVGKAKGEFSMGWEF